MKTPITPESVLQNLAQIQRLDRGSVSVIRQGPAGPYYNHQRYENGRNVSRYVPTEQVAEFQAALADYQRFQQLVRQYVELLVARTRAERQAGSKKAPPTPDLLLAQDQEIHQLMAQFQGQEPNGPSVQHLEVLVRSALFKPANALVGFLLQTVADRIDAAYQPQPGQARKGRETRQVQGLFGTFPLTRDYYTKRG
jgi:hypothetical protein